MSRPLVIKFGGTAIATLPRIRRAALRVRAHVRRGRSVVVVVSAQGHTTDRILRQIALLGPALPAGARHDTVATAARAREVDRALATGEDRSAALLAAALWSLGVPARSLRGGESGIRAEGAFGGGNIRHVASGRLRRVLDAQRVPIISGFQGERTDGETVTLGRGGSDTSAVAIAAALDAECHIVSDVEGVFDRDPNVHADAQRLPRLTHGALVALVERGAQVVHPAAASLASFGAVPLRVYHWRAPLSGRGGTIIGAAGSAARTADGGAA